MPSGARGGVARRREGARQPPVSTKTVCRRPRSCWSSWSAAAVLTPLLVGELEVARTRGALAELFVDPLPELAEGVQEGRGAHELLDLRCLPLQAEVAHWAPDHLWLAVLAPPGHDDRDALQQEGQEPLADLEPATLDLDTPHRGSPRRERVVEVGLGPQIPVSAISQSLGGRVPPGVVHHEGRHVLAFERSRHGRDHGFDAVLEYATYSTRTVV
mmetsp:Transcript_30990/g.81473  ORF Transcript_30990/g.81473 Transcript_30990/m.81473 type:complete len:215 (+) Transcript_30990:374-1018(+)